MKGLYHPQWYYAETAQQFVESDADIVFKELKRRNKVFCQQRGFECGNGCDESWRQSLDELKDICSELELTDQIVILEGIVAKTFQKVDALIAGRTKEDEIGIGFIEMKGWSTDRIDQVLLSGDWRRPLEVLYGDGRKEFHEHPSVRLNQISSNISKRINRDRRGYRTKIENSIFFHNAEGLPHEWWYVLDREEFGVDTAPIVTKGARQDFVSRIDDLVGHGGGLVGMELLRKALNQDW